MERRICGELTVLQALQEHENGNKVIALQIRTQEIIDNEVILSGLDDYLPGVHFLMMEPSFDQELEQGLYAEEDVTETAEDLPESLIEPDVVKMSVKVSARKSSGKGKVDEGKIMALHNAGRTNAWIADEMKMSEKSVWYYINKAKKEAAGGKGKK